MAKADNPPELDRLKSMVGTPSIHRAEDEEEEVIGPEQRALQMEPGILRRPGGEGFIAPFSYIIEPYIPEEYELWFTHFKAMISNILPNANIRRQDIPRYLTYFDALWLWLKVRGAPIPDEARISFRMTMELQLTRAIDMAEAKLRVTQRQVSEAAAPPTQEGKKKSGLRRLVPF